MQTVWLDLLFCKVETPSNKKEYEYFIALQTYYDMR